MGTSIPLVSTTPAAVPLENGTDNLKSLGSSTTATHHHHSSHLRHALHHDTSSASFSPHGSRAIRGSGNDSGSSTSHLTGLRSIPIHLIQYGIAILLRIRAALPLALQPWFWVGLWFIFAVMGIAVFVGFHARIFELLESMATFIKGLGRAGPPIIMLGLFLTAFPPLFGYSSLVTMSGYVYGFRFGLFIAYTSALLGSITCFYLCRRWFKVQVRALMAKKQSMKSVVKAVEKRGFKLMILIRLAPYPFNVMNALLSATHIPLSTFAFATALSLTKLALHVYIGSTLSSLAPTIPPTNENEIPGGGNDGGDMDPLPDNPHGRALKIVVMVVSMIIGIAVGAYVWIVAKREIEASEGIRIERRRKRRESLRQSRAFQRSSLGGITAGRGSARAGHHLLPRGGSSGGMDLTDIDLASGHGNEGSDFVGGGAMYDYPDEDEGQEDQALVGGGAGAELHARAASGSSPTSRLEYGSDSEESDYLDEDDDGDMSDMERGINDEQALLQDSADMDMCNLPSSHRQPNYHHSHSQLRGTEQETMGWFAQNGVDMSDRVW